jgi:teichuronic acid biosynthesis glycosyltransferase TuaG
MPSYVYDYCINKKLNLAIFKQDNEKLGDSCKMNIQVEEGLVSIITPAYNCEKYIAETIESVLRQTYNYWEMIIINDCSSDKSQEIIEHYAEVDSRIKLVNLEKNFGVVASRNIALDLSVGEYIAFLDSDDLWKSKKLEKQINFMKVNKYAFCFTGYELIGENGISLKKVIKPPSYINYSQAIKKTSIGCLTVCINRRIVGDFRMPQLKHGEDHATWILILQKHFIAYSINESLAYYRVSKKSLTGNKLKVIRMQWKNYRDFYKFSLFKSTICFFCYTFYAIKKRI